MGFKLAYLLDQLTPGIGTGQNTLAIPYNAQTSLANVADLFLDINDTTAPGCTIGVNCPVFSISRLVRSNDTLQTYGTGAAAFPLVPGEGLLVALAQFGNVPYVVVGSHAPGLVIDIQGPNPPLQSGQNFFAYPYHGVAATASDLENEIELLGGTPLTLPPVGAVNSISRLVRSDDTLDSYVSTLSDFALEPGRFYYIGMAANAPSNIAYVPAHY
jgi:hypothetical protein